MRDKEKTLTKGQKIVAGAFALGCAVLVVLAIVEGEVWSGRHSKFERATDPFFYWVYLLMTAGAVALAALLASGRVRLKTPPDFEARLQRKFASNMTFLALLGAGGCGWIWLTEGSTARFTDIAGWLGLLFLGLATWPPLLPPGPMRVALRAVGTVAIIIAGIMIFRLTR